MRSIRFVGGAAMEYTRGDRANSTHINCSMKKKENSLVTEEENYEKKSADLPSSPLLELVTLFAFAFICLCDVRYMLFPITII